MNQLNDENLWSEMIVFEQDNIQDEFLNIVVQLEQYYQQQPRRDPVRFRKVWNLFCGKKKRLISLNDLAAEFSTKNPRQDAINTICQLNKSLSKLGFVIKKTTAYQIQRTSENK